MGLYKTKFDIGDIVEVTEEHLLHQNGKLKITGIEIWGNSIYYQFLGHTICAREDTLKKVEITGRL